MLMVLPLLFLSKYLNISDSAWASGPEIIFNVTVLNELLVPRPKTDELERLSNHGLTSQLKCLYKEGRGDEWLYCHLENTKKFRNSFKLDFIPKSQSRANYEIGQFELDYNDFEIQFGDYGIETIATADSISQKDFEFMNEIFNQLHAGIMVQLLNTYKQKEVFHYGTCLTEYKILYYNESGQATNQSVWSPGTGVILEKNRDMNKCFPDWINNYKNILDFDFSRSKLIGDSDGFIATTQSMSNIIAIVPGLSEKPVSIKSQLLVRVELDSVVPAKRRITEKDYRIYKPIENAHDESNNLKLRPKNSIPNPNTHSKYQIIPRFSPYSTALNASIY